MELSFPISLFPKHVITWNINNYSENTNQIQLVSVQSKIFLWL